MDKRYQVFVSSTYDDLRKERQEVIQALLELDCIPAGMELFPAADDDQWTLIKKVIDDCDYYLVVIGGRYGSIGPDGKSYTQMEYEYALGENKPIIGFLHKDPTSLSVKRTEKSEKGRKLLEEFRGLVQHKMCKYWTNPDDLGSVVSRSLIKLIKNTPAIGWVKADLIPSKDTTEELLRLRQQVEELQNQLADENTGFDEDISSLSQGDDHIYLKIQIGFYKEDSKYRFSPDYTVNRTITLTWNSIFASMSPLLIDEASDSAIKKGINPIIATAIGEQVKEDEEIKFSNLASFNLASESYSTIIVQFLALQLISKSTKKKARSVSDRSAYWSLTQRGEGLMMRLRAIRREKDGEKT